VTPTGGTHPGGGIGGGTGRGGGNDQDQPGPLAALLAHNPAAATAVTHRRLEDYQRAAFASATGQEAGQ
jgi:hypothetical protein